MRRRELLVKKDTVDPNTGRGTYNNYEYVDLQLTGNAANLMFATCNVGASAETEHGDYYQWGAGANKYKNTDQYYDGSSSVLPYSADTARQVMGGEWKMPSYNQLKAFTAQTFYKRTTINGVQGGKFYRTINGNERYVFFPSAGYYYYGTFYDGSNVYVWSNNSANSANAYYLYLTDTSKYLYSTLLMCGSSIRGVFKKT